jgi:hypothetical protein
MSSTKNPFLAFLNIETDKMVGINIHNITTYHEKIDDEGKHYVLVLCVDDRYGRKIDVTFEEFERLLKVWYELKRHPQA